MPRQTKNDKNECELAEWYQNSKRQATYRKPLLLYYWQPRKG